jgi:hypothetical protein
LKSQATSDPHHAACSCRSAMLAPLWLVHDPSWLTFTMSDA